MRLLSPSFPNSFMPALDPNYDFLYLNDMLGADHPAYEELTRRYEGTPEGKRINEFKKENEKYQDGLEIATHNKIDGIIRNEEVPFKGDTADRIAKIRAIRRHRSSVEEEKIRLMSKEEREKYIEEAKKEKEEMKKKMELRTHVDTEALAKKNAVRQAVRTSFEEMQYQRMIEREKNRQKNREVLEKNLETRKGKPDPIQARELAVKERERKETELAEKLQENDELALQEKEKENTDE